jgi:uncharacterized protein YkuJ
MLNIIVQEVTVETVQKGRNSWKVANVTYSDNGKNFNKKIVSFKNPSVFDAVQNAKQGDAFEVKVVKDGEYYNWSELKPAGVLERSAPTTRTAQAGVTKVPVSNYETPDERKARQLLIVKQSSVSSALELHKANNPKGGLDLGAVLVDSQKIVDFVYGNTLEAEVTLETMDNDIQY